MRADGRVDVGRALQPALVAAKLDGALAARWGVSVAPASARERVALARAMAPDPAILVADEPTGNLDAVTAEEILNLFARLNTKLGTTLLVVTHDPHVAERATRQVTVVDGQIHGGHLHDAPHEASTRPADAAPDVPAIEVAT